MVIIATICDLCGVMMEEGDCAATMSEGKLYAENVSDYEDNDRHICMECTRNLALIAQKNDWLHDWGINP